MKKTKKLTIVAMLTFFLFIGAYSVHESSLAQGEPAPQCTCYYPSGNGPQYGVLQRLPQPLPSGERDTCVVKRCYLRVSGGDDDRIPQMPQP